jgi:putative ABC transport system permease protein
MLSPRWKKVIRDIWGNRTRTALVVLSVAVGVFSIGMVAGSHAILFRDLTAQYLAARPASATLFTAPFDDDLVQAIRSVPGVGWAEGRRIINVRVKVGPNEWNDMQLIAISDFGNSRINQFWPERGAAAPQDRELLVERASLETVNADVGDVLTIEMPSKKLREMRLAGVVHDITQALPSFSGRGSAYITFNTLEWLGEQRDFDRLDFVVAEKPLDVQHIRGVLDAVSDKVQRGGRRVLFTRIPTPGEHPSDRFIRPMLLLLGVLGVVALFLSGFLVINTISALLMQQIRQIGVMKAIGGSRFAITLMYLGMGGVFGFSALIVGMPLGVLGAAGFTQFMAAFINFDIADYSIPAWVFAVQAVIGLVAPFLAALYPVIQGTRITVREAITDYGLGQGQSGQGLVDRILARVSGLSRPQQISLRNTFRRKARLGLTLVTLILAGAMFMAVLSLRASLIYTFDQAFKFENYDIKIDLERSYRTIQVEQEAPRVPGVVAAESWESTLTRRKRPDGNSSDNIILVAPPAGTKMITPDMLEGRWLVPEDENAIVVNTELARLERDVRVGDSLIFDIDGRDTTWRVVGIVKGIFAPATAYTNYDYLSRTTREVGRTRSVRVVTRLQSAAFETEIASALEGYFDTIGVRTTAVTTVAETQARAQTGSNIMVVFMVVMAALLAVVGGLGLMGTMSINVLERTREIGVMRAVGASDWGVQQIFILEGVIIGLLSWVIAALLAYPLSNVLSDVVGIAFVQAPLNFVFSPVGILIWLAIVTILAALSSFLPAWNASRLTVREILAYQ